MTTNYIVTIEYLHPEYEGYYATDPENYNTINWGSNTPITQIALDSAWNAAELNQAKRNKKTDMRLIRDAAFNKTVSYLGNDHEMQSKSTLYLIMAMAYINAGNTLPVDFKMPISNGTGVTADAAYIETLLSNTLSQMKNNMDIYISKCGIIDACSDTACVNAVTWS